MKPEINNKAEEEKLHIAIVGKQNVGKSKLVNCIISQKLSFLNELTEKKTDVVSRVVELTPFGPRVIVDTAGIEDTPKFGKKAISNAIKFISNADFVIIVLDAREQLDAGETKLIEFLRQIKIPFLVTVNKIEYGINPQLLIELEALEITHFEISCKENAGIDNFKKKLIHLLPTQRKTFREKISWPEI